MSWQGRLHTLENCLATWNLQWNVKSWYRFSWSYEDAEWLWTCAEIISIALMLQQLTTFISIILQEKQNCQLYYPHVCI